MQPKEWKLPAIKRHAKQTCKVSADLEEEDSLGSQMFQLEELFHQTMKDIDAFHFHPPADTSIFQPPGMKLKVLPNLPQIKVENCSFEKEKDRNNSDIHLPSINSNVSLEKQKNKSIIKHRLLERDISKIKAASVSSKTSIEGSDTCPSSAILPEVQESSSSSMKEGLPFKLRESLSVSKKSSARNSSIEEEIKLPKIKKSHRDYFKASSQNADGVYQSMEKWLVEYNCHSQSNCQLPKKKFRSIEKITSVPLTQSAFDFDLQPEDAEPCIVPRKPKPSCSKSHSTIWIIAKTLTRLNKEAQCKTPQPLTHHDVAKLLANKTAEKIRKATQPYTKSKNRRNNKECVKKRRDKRNNFRKMFSSTDEEILLNNESLTKESRQTPNPPNKNEMRPSINILHSASCSIRQPGLSPAPLAKSCDSVDSSHSRMLAGSQTSSAKRLESTKTMDSASLRASLSPHCSGKDVKRDGKKEIPAHLQIPLWWVEL